MNKSPPATCNTNEAEHLTLQARSHMQKGEMEQAEPLLHTALKQQKSALALRLLGNIVYQKTGAAAAIPYYTEALQLDPADHAAYAMLAEACFKLGNPDCLQYSMAAISHDSDNLRYKERFIHFTREALLQEYNQALADTVIRCLHTGELEPENLQHVWFQLFALNPYYKKIYRTVNKTGSINPLKKIAQLYAGASTTPANVTFDTENFHRQKDLLDLCTPFFLEGLRNIRINSIPFESFLTALRARLLKEWPTYPVQPAAHTQLAAALAQYSFETNYIFATTDAETAAISAIKTLLENPDTDLAGNALPIAVYACYAPLHRLTTAKEIVQIFAKSPILGPLVRIDIEEYFKLQQKKATLSVTTALDDATSLRVQEQYEEFPYPRWRSKPSGYTAQGPATELAAPGTKILVAGCGTGYETALLSVACPTADITAIDLSKASLAYASLRAEEYGLNNIHFGHGDILNLDYPDAHFDAIFSSGVLHHMADPVAGWISLKRCLRPAGLMRISLYSQCARRHIMLARNIIAKNKFPHTTEGMKRFRDQMNSLLPADTCASLIRANDFYQLSMLRDMLFHAQEHCMTLPQIQSILDELNLTFVYMSVSAQTRTEFQKMFPEEQDGSSLANWHAFEQKNPDTFIGMYQFWCRK